MSQGGAAEVVEPQSGVWSLGSASPPEKPVALAAHFLLTIPLSTSSGTDFGRSMG
eukprot:CAMPEP_0175423762 /NCGR_PEP_ID=MMETSP0095-20121207/48431_1 /TAXON_ID=311494 /ORGANISM="Alexandrium monilatum, Strain CCMP3105" /LENGTH=54 /DNA_ID=CAMNT_0016723033 /DNA_START=173 /DNA_END=333 /DNA_ORIENTATION=+